MIKYIKKLIKKQRLLRKYKINIKNYINLLNWNSIEKGSFWYESVEKDLLRTLIHYNRLKKL